MTSDAKGPEATRPPGRPTREGEQRAPTREPYIAPTHPAILGIPEIAELAGFPRSYVDTLRHRGRLPEPAWTIGGRPAWDRQVIEEWLKVRRVHPVVRVVLGLDNPGSSVTPL